MVTTDFTNLKQLLRNRKFFFKEYMTENHKILKIDNGDTFIDILFSKATGALKNIRENRIS
jgi:hypothetical protein